MASFVIEGGYKLHGDIYPQGAKNEMLQIICATLLTGDKVTVELTPYDLSKGRIVFRSR